MKKLLGHEALVFLCSMMSGTVVLPVFTMVVLALFGLMPRNASLAECYDALREMLEPNVWLFWVAVLSPYGIVQAVRIVLWKRRGGPWYVEKEQNRYPAPDSHNAYCEFSFMTWKDGLDDLRRPESHKETRNG
ncbi:MAG TPA: hypothetical protein ENN79_03270 [Desulfobacteraceae bacterium]|nr:hypothetical protein [Desulfobacteraceae bacterium]